MEERCFVDKAVLPDEDLVREALGKQAVFFERLVAFAIDGGWRGDWKYYNKRYGWTWKAERKKKALYWLAPAKGGLLVGMAVRKEEKEAVLVADFSETIKRPVRVAKEFPEGYGVQWFIKDEKGYEETFAVVELVAGMR